MRGDTEKKEHQFGHPGPYCIVCKEPFGVSDPIGVVYTPEGLKPYYIQEVVETTSESFCQCLECMKKEERIKEDAFKETLTNEQKSMFKELQEISSDVASYIILMS